MDTPQEKIDSAFEKLLNMSEVLREDFNSLLDSESESHHWRRNFIRTTAILAEGLSHCLREACPESFNCEFSLLNKNEKKVILVPSTFEAVDRIKYTLCAAYKFYSLQPLPDFGGISWVQVKDLIKKRNALTHPETPQDLEVSNENWKEYYAGSVWLLEQHFNFLAICQEKYG